MILDVAGLYWLVFTGQISPESPMIFMGKSGWFPVSRFSLKSTHYQRVKHPIKSHRTTIFPWFSYGFPWLKVGPKTALNPLRGDLHVEVCGGSDPEFVAGGQMAMGQNLCHIWVVIHIHKSHPFTIYFDVHERCQGFDPLPFLLLTTYEWPMNRPVLIEILDPWWFGSESMKAMGKSMTNRECHKMTIEEWLVGGRTHG